MIGQLRNIAVANNIKPEMESITGQMNAARQAGDNMAAARHSGDLKKLFAKHNYSPFKSLLTPLIQAPIFVSFFIGLRKMAELPVESLKTGGALWFPDLTAMDPYYALPVLSAATFLLTIELGTDGISAQQQGTMKKVFRGMAVIMVPLTYSMPSVSLSEPFVILNSSSHPFQSSQGVFVYWVTSNIFSFAQFFVLRAPALRSYFKIPAMIKHKENPNIKKQGFFDSMKANYKSQVEKGQESNRMRRLEEERASRIAAGPPVIHTNRKRKGAAAATSTDNPTPPPASH